MSNKFLIIVMTVIKYEILVKNKMYAEMCGLENFYFQFLCSLKMREKLIHPLRRSSFLLLSLYR